MGLLEEIAAQAFQGGPLYSPTDLQQAEFIGLHKPAAVADPPDRIDVDYKLWMKQQKDVALIRGTKVACAVFGFVALAQTGMVLWQANDIAMLRHALKSADNALAEATKERQKPPYVIDSFQTNQSFVLESDGKGNVEWRPR